MKSKDFEDVIEDMILYFYKHKYNEPNKDMIRRKILYLLCVICPDEITLEENIKKLKEGKQ